VENLSNVLPLVVDGGVGSKALDQFHVRHARRRRHRRTSVLGELTGKRTDTARARLDEDHAPNARAHPGADTAGPPDREPFAMLRLRPDAVDTAVRP